MARCAQRGCNKDWPLGSRLAVFVSLLLGSLIKVDMPSWELMTLGRLVLQSCSRHDILADEGDQSRVTKRVREKSFTYR